MPGHYSPSTTESRGNVGSRTPAQRKAEADITIRYISIGLGGMLLLTITCFTIFGGQAEYQQRLDTLLKFILPFSGTFLGIAIGRKM